MNRKEKIKLIFVHENLTQSRFTLKKSWLADNYITVPSLQKTYHFVPEKMIIKRFKRELYYNIDCIEPIDFKAISTKTKIKGANGQRDIELTPETFNLVAKQMELTKLIRKNMLEKIMLLVILILIGVVINLLLGGFNVAKAGYDGADVYAQCYNATKTIFAGG